MINKLSNEIKGIIIDFKSGVGYHPQTVTDRLSRIAPKQGMVVSVEFADGQTAVVFALKRGFKDGTNAIVFDHSGAFPTELTAKTENHLQIRRSYSGRLLPVSTRRMPR